MIRNFILWYLKRNNICFVQHEKYGWKVKINFYEGMSNPRMEEWNMETYKKYDLDN